MLFFSLPWGHQLGTKPRDTVLDMNKSHITQAVYMHRPAQYPVMLQLTASNCSSLPVFACYLPGPDKPTRAFDQFDQKQPKRLMNPHANFSTPWRWKGPFSSIHKWWGVLRLVPFEWWLSYLFSPTTTLEIQLPKSSQFWIKERLLHVVCFSNE